MGLAGQLAGQLAEPLTGPLNRCIPTLRAALIQNAPKNGLFEGACHLYALTLNPSPNLGRGTLGGFSPLLPILEKLVLSLSKGVGDEGNTGICKRDMLPCSTLCTSPHEST